MKITQDEFLALREDIRYQFVDHPETVRFISDLDDQYLKGQNAYYSKDASLCWSGDITELDIENAAQIEVSLGRLHYAVHPLTGREELLINGDIEDYLKSNPKIWDLVPLNLSSFYQWGRITEDARDLFDKLINKQQYIEQATFSDRPLDLNDFLEVYNLLVQLTGGAPAYNNYKMYEFRDLLNKFNDEQTDEMYSQLVTIYAGCADPLIEEIKSFMSYHK